MNVNIFLSLFSFFKTFYENININNVTFSLIIIFCLCNIFTNFSQYFHHFLVSFYLNKLFFCIVDFLRFIIGYQLQRLRPSATYLLFLNYFCKTLSLNILIFSKTIPLSSLFKILHKLLLENILYHFFIIWKIIITIAFTIFITGFKFFFITTVKTF